MKTVLAVAWSVFLVYLMGSFIAASFYIREWDDLWRGIVGFLMSGAAICTYGYMEHVD